VLRRCLLCTLLFGLLAVHLSRAQQERILPRKGGSSLEGTRFIVGFMQNELEEFRAAPRLQIFIASQFDAVVTIDYPVFGPVVRYVRANSVFTETVPASYAAISSETVQELGIGITSDVPVVVYTVNTLAASTDSYIAIPIKHLGTDYLTVCRPNDRYNLSSPSATLDTVVRSSEFMVLAPEDGTVIEVTPSVRTYRGQAGVTQTVTLNRNQTYFVKSARTPVGTGDLSGSRIRSSKPVAVLSGHMRTSIPRRDVYSKDHLVEMLPPIAKWGKRYATTPFALVRNGDYVRIVASEDNTQVTFSSELGSASVQLNSAGESIEFQNVDIPILWSSDKPFLVVQFMPSRQPTDTTENIDPAMVVVPPIEQFVSSALIQFPTLEKQDDIPGQTFHFFINLVVEETALPTLTIDGTLATTMVPALATQVMAGTTLHWAQVRLQPGVHSLTCEEGTFSGVMYGTSRFDSYANLFGVSYEPQPVEDRSPPTYRLTVNCGTVEGTIQDTSRTNVPKVDNVTVQTAYTTNFRWNISPPLDTNGTTEFYASVKDPWQDGVITIHSYDDQGNGREWVYRYDAPDIAVPRDVQLASVTGGDCDTVWIRNQDSTPVHIRNVRLIGDVRFSVTPSRRDTTLAAHDSIFVIVCFRPDSTGDVGQATLAVDLPCDLRKDIDVRVTTSASLVAHDLDFGPVRIGDTACARVAVVNTGSVSIVVDTLSLAGSFPQFVVDAAAAGLPKTLAPGDTILVRVCFTPDSIRTYSRTDTVESTPAINPRMSYRGRGIRPDVHDVVIDWGRRRIGTINDTTITLANLGEAACTVMIVREEGRTAPFVMTRFRNRRLSFSGNDRVADLGSFQPVQVGPFEARYKAVVDWRYHDTVTITLRGVGTLPEITPFDIDMGSVLVNTPKDSIATVLHSGGNEPLTLHAFRISGPDVAAFTIDPAMLAPGQQGTNLDRNGLIRFVPTRSGDHVMYIDVDHDAAPAYATMTSRITIRGRGRTIDEKDYISSMTAPASAIACHDVPYSVSFRNTGDVDVVIDSIDVNAGGIPVPLDVVVFPDTIMPGQERTWTGTTVFDRTTPSKITAHIVGRDIDIVHEKNVRIIYSPSQTAITPQITTEPGKSFSVDMAWHTAATLASSQPLTITATVPRSRLVVEAATVDAIVTHNGIQTRTTVRIEQNEQRFVMTFDSMAVPADITWSVPLLAMLKDPAQFTIILQAGETSCIDGSSAVAGIVAEQCASGLRMVRLGTIPVVHAAVHPQPASESFDLEVLSTLETVVNVHIVNVAGDVVALGQNLSLIKGSQHFKFTHSGLSSGLYRLVVQHGSGEVSVPVIIVN